jgi:ABC-type branched-subunit amino acid transport system substrate-binding protein
MKLAITTSVMEGLMVKFRRDSGKGLRPGVALIGTMAIVLGACTAGGSANPSTVPSTAASQTVALDPIPMKFGAILPRTGGLSPIIDALEEPLRMAAEEINAVSDGLVSVDFADDGTDSTVASQNVDKYLTGDYNAIIGPAASGVAADIFDKVNTAGMVMCSGTSTGALFSGEKYNPNHVRTAPSDLIQGPLLANLIVEDGYTNVAVIWQNTEYGEGFGQAVSDTLEEAGATLAMSEGFDPTQTSFSDVAQDVVASGAEAMAMITYAEGGQILLDLQSAGFDGQIYVADGFVDTVTPEAVGGPAVLEGLRGTYPSVAPEDGEPTFGTRFKAFAPDAPTVFSAHMYDCLATLTLAAQVAQSSVPADYVDEIIGVTRDGEKCSLIADCLEMVWAGTDIDYDGASGPLDFTENGEPGVGTYDIFTFNAEGVHVNEEQIQGSIGG